MPKILESLADQLTPEEVAAYEAEDEDAAVEAIAEMHNPPEADEDEEPDADPELADSAPQAQAKAPAAAPEESTIDIDGHKSAIAEIDKEIDNLGELRENLEISKEEFNKRMAELSDQRAPYVMGLKNETQRREADTQQWIGTVRSYLDANPGLNDGGEVIQAFDRAVKAITGNPKFASLSNEEALARAHSLLTTQADVLGISVPPVTAKAPAGKKAAKEPTQAKDTTEEVGGVVPTLAKAPSSDVSSLNDSPYAQLENIMRSGNAVEIEEAMMRLPADKRDQFASMMIE